MALTTVLVDRSQRGKLAFTGEDAVAFLDSLVTNDVTALEPGHGLYAAVLTTKGKMLGDLRIAHLGDELWADTERDALQAVFEVLWRGRVGYRVELHKRTLEQALLSVAGPRAREACGADAAGLGADEHDNARSEIAGVPCLLITTLDGVDVVCAAADREAMRLALVDGGAVDADEAALDVARVERGRPRYGVDLDSSVIPQEAGLNDRAVSFTKGCYPGQETVARLFYRGKPNRHLRGLRLAAPVAEGTALRAGDREVGRVSSVVRSPTHGPIALALVRREVAPGDRVGVGEDGAEATVVALPFAT